MEEGWGYCLDFSAYCGKRNEITNFTSSKKKMAWTLLFPIPKLGVLTLAGWSSSRVITIA